MKIHMRVAAAQINTTVGDLYGNTKKIIRYIKQAKRQGADIITFPELALCGYPPEDLLLKWHFINDNMKMLKEIVGETSDITAVVGCLDRDRHKHLYNAAAIMNNGKLKGIYHKIELPNYGVFDEKRYFTPGKENLIFELGDITFGVNICEDIWKHDGPYKRQAAAGAQLLANISSSPYHAGKIDLRENMLKSRARETNTFILYNNLVGGQDELVFDGGSVIFNAKGEIVASGRQFEETLVTADLEIRKAGRRKAKAPNSLAIKTIRLSRREKSGKKPLLVRGIPKRLGRCEEIYNALVLGTRDYVRKNGFKKVVLGLSGGIDSALTALIACDAIGKENVAGVSMPSQYSSDETQSDAKRLAKNMGIRFMIVPIGNLFDVYISTLKEEFKGAKPDIAEENLQARIRGNILMALSNKFGWLVLTTGNKSETSVGYCTLYGDMAGGFAVIKDVPKTLVYELANFANKRRGGSIPESIFSREPSAELRSGQKDRDTLPPYSVLDSVLKSYIEEDKSFEEITSKKFKREVVKNTIRMVDRNEYKRRQSPPGIKITPKAFGKDRRFPITNRYKEF